MMKWKFGQVCDWLGPKYPHPRNIHIVHIGFQRGVINGQAFAGVAIILLGFGIIINREGEEK